MTDEETKSLISELAEELECHATIRENGILRWCHLCRGRGDDSDHDKSCLLVRAGLRKAGDAGA